MTTVESIIAEQSERYADTSYFLPVQSTPMWSYVVDAAFEHALSNNRSKELRERIRADQEHNRAVEISREYLQEEGVKGMALGIFVSEQMTTGRHILTLPWVMSRELAADRASIRHAAIATEVISAIAGLELGPLRQTEGYGYVLNIHDKRTVFVLDSLRDRRILANSAVKKGLQDTLRVLPNVEVAYGSQIIRAR